jgi:hypothetical protein
MGRDRGFGLGYLKPEGWWEDKDEDLRRNGRREK